MANNSKLHGGINADTVGIVKLALEKGYLQQVIASYFRDNIGRVSEAKTGKRWKQIPAATELPDDFPV